MNASEIYKLPDPDRSSDFPLMKALELRRSKRKWEKSDLSDQEISDLLWAACGETLKETKRSKNRRTAPSARNSQSVRVYIALAKGLFLFDEKRHCLIKVLSEDIREFISNQKMMKSAPVGLIYVADYSRLKGYTGTDEKRKLFVTGTETGFISQNVYLYCASTNLNTVVIGLVNREKLEGIMGLKEHEKVVYTQAVGRSR